MFQVTRWRSSLSSLPVVIVLLLQLKSGLFRLGEAFKGCGSTVDAFRPAIAMPTLSVRTSQRQTNTVLSASTSKEDILELTRGNCHEMLQSCLHTKKEATRQDKENVVDARQLCRCTGMITKRRKLGSSVVFLALIIRKESNTRSHCS